MSTVKISTLLTKITHVTFATAVACLVINIIFAFYLERLPHWLFRILGTGEQSVLTWASSALLLYCALMLVSIGQAAKQREGQSTSMWRRWIELAIVFFLMSMDEVAQLHEGATDILVESYDLQGYLYFAWVIPGAAFAVVIFTRSLGLLRTLPAATRKRMVYSGAIYLAGAIGIEAVGANYSFHTGKVQDLTFQLLNTVEEGLEVLGLWLFLRALIVYSDFQVSVDSPLEDTALPKVEWTNLLAELGRAAALGLAIIVVTDLISPYLIKLDSSKVPGLIEAEWLPRIETKNCQTEYVRLRPEATAGGISRNSLLQLVPRGPGAQQSFTLQAPRPGKYRLAIYMAKHQSFGEVNVRLNGTPLRNINLYAPSNKVLPTGSIDLGKVELGETNTLTILLLKLRQQYAFDGIHLSPVKD